MSSDEVERARSYLDSGVAAFQAGRLDEAHEHLRRPTAAFANLVRAGRTELEPDLARSWNTLGIVHGHQGALEASAEAHSHSAALLKRCVAERGLWQHEGGLAEALLAVTEARSQQGAFAIAENYLWHAAGLVPHLPSVLQAAVRFYGQWFSADEAALTTGGLQRDDVRDGYGTILCCIAPYHPYGAGARIAMAQHHHLLGDQAEARGVLEQAVADYGADTPGVYAHLVGFLLATGDHAAAWTTCEQGWRAFAAHLEAAGNDPSSLPVDQTCRSWSRDSWCSSTPDWP